ncbi:OmpA family protein [Maribacter polysiphoniae]|uniref:OmpA family protein n=1 Tax=Maribacter polysiphoniae TaxID=429344 RepID=A0A316DJW3_9FLAO|nr:OmpA family protein [Maribacter polysiphoniae]MBD1263205.1 OmpA family protein [Maribacter polysiphoniae]PWK17858.1 WD40 repeat protein [Maribacter polysiphoniae]
MNKKNILLVMVLAFLVTQFTWGQEKLLNKANQRYQEYSFSPAIDIYKRVLDKGYVSADLLKNLGNSYYFNADYKEAADTYKKLLAEYSNDIGPEYYFRYSQSLKSLGDYKASKEMMSKFSSLTADDVRAGFYKGEKDYLDEIKKNSGRYDIKSFDYNTFYSEFAPSYYKAGLIFSSDRDTGNLARYRHTWNSKDFLDLYKVDTDSLDTNHVMKLGEDVNTRLHESTSVVTSDGKHLYFTRNNFKDGKYITDENGIIRLKLLRATLIDGVWTNIQELPFNSDSYSTAHPAFSPDGRTLYFASDMPGSLGQSDIFSVTVYADGKYGTPKNLGNTINTEARETFPFITSDNVLYFSSDGHPGLGGLDVFATKIESGKYDRAVVNVGEPVNSKMDDFTFIFNEDTREGYFASNRDEGLGADDIYAFVETVPLKLVCDQAISGTVRDKITNEVLVGATVKVIDEDNEEVYTTITDSNGNYKLSIDCNRGNFVRALMQGYVPSEEYLGKSDGKPNIIDFYLERDQVTAGFGDDLAKLLQLSTIYFDFDKYNIRKDSEIEVQKVIAAMEKYPSLRIKVNSHTDSRGKDSYNLWLSQKRAESTVEYMISKGIAESRLKGEGFGETKLMNQCENGVRCSAKEHEKNRRSEFIILE